MEMTTKFQCCHKLSVMEKRAGFKHVAFHLQFKRMQRRVETQQSRQTDILVISRPWMLPQQVCITVTFIMLIIKNRFASVSQAMLLIMEFPHINRHSATKFLTNFKAYTERKR